MNDYVPSYGTHPPSFTSEHSETWQWWRSWLLHPDGSCPFTVLLEQILERPLAVIDGPPESQGVFGYPDLVVQTALGTHSMLMDALDLGVVSLANAITPVGFTLPAARLFSAIHIGLPHCHLPPPAPPMLGAGLAVMVGALNVLVGGLPALRSGDVGFAPTCLGPTFRVFTGSVSVMVGGRRAARVGDLTEQCPLVRITGGATLATAFNPITLLSLATSTLAHVAAAANAAGDASEAGGDDAAFEEASARNAAEVQQAILGAIQGAADASLSALHATIGVPPPLVGTGSGMLLPAAAPPRPVNIGGLPMPDLSDLLALAGRTPWGRRVRARARIVRMRRRERGLWCALFGHPVDAVTGRVIGDHLDADLGDGLLLQRRYDSGARARVGDFGAGQRHTFERELDVWLHRVRYTDAHGTVVDFPAFRGADRLAIDGYVVMRLGGGRYEVSFAGETMVFVATPGARSARLLAIRRAGAELAIEHDGEGRFHAVRSGARALLVQRAADGRIVTLCDALGTELASYAYDREHLVAARDARGHEERFEHDGAGRLAGWRDQRGRRFTWRYDDASRCVHTSGQDGEWSCDFVYDLRKTIVTHASGLTETLEHDAYGTVLRIARSDGTFLLREQDATLRVVRERDAAGRVIELVYDDDGALVARRDRFGNVLPAEPRVDAPSPLARELPATLASQLGVTRSEGNHARDALPDALRSLAAWALPTPRSARAPSVERDTVGRITRVSDADGRTTSFRRDAAGNVVSITDRDQRETRVVIAGWNLAGSMIDSLGRRADRTYTATDEVRSHRDPRGSLTEYGRDTADRVTSVTRAGRLRATYTWDAGERLVEKRDGAGALVLRITPHANALPQRIALTEGGTIELDYDPRGRVTRAKLGTHDARLSRDDDGVVVSDYDGAVGVRRWRVLDSEITSVVERFETRIDRKSDRVIVRDPTGGLSSFETQRGRFVRRLANGTDDVLAIDLEGRLEGRLAHRVAAGEAITSWAVRYERSGEGDVLSVWDAARGERRFEVDVAHRLEAEIDERGVRHSFTHDAGDDVVANDDVAFADIAVDGVLLRTSAETFAHDARDRMATRRDAAGRETHYGYDDLDQLVRVVLPDGRVWRGSYDGLGRLRRFGAVAETTLVWDGDRIAAEVGSSGALRVHLYCDARALIPFGFVDYASVESAPESGRVYFVFHDASGMPTQIEDAAGRIVWWADRVDPYGAITLREGAELDYALRWPGHYFDHELGLHHNRFRAYDPRVSRYLQPDPIGHAGSPNSLYAYAPNPLRDVDLLGLSYTPRPTHGAEEPIEGRPLHELAAEWGVDPRTRRVLPGATLYGVPIADVERLALRPPQRGEVHAIERRRRHLAEYRGQGPLPMDRWVESGFVANHNRLRSRPYEEAALAHLGAIRNNGPEDEGGQRTHQYTEYVDRNGRSLGPTVDRNGNPLPMPERAVAAREVIARPDGILENGDGTFDVIEHKHLSSEDGGVLGDSDQLRAEREMAQRNGGQHVVVLSSESGLDETGQPRVRVTRSVAEGSVVLYYDMQSRTMMQLNPSTGRFDRLPS